MKTLKLITFVADLTQFLVEADDDLAALVHAIEANLSIPDTNPGAQIFHDSYYYTIEDIDFDQLKELIKRDDWVMFKDGEYSAVIFPKPKEKSND